MLATDQSVPKFGSGNFCTFHFPTLHTGEINYSLACSTMHITSLHTISAQFIALLYMHTTYSQAFYLCYFCMDLSIIKDPLDSDCLVVQMCWYTWQREALSGFSDFNELCFALL